MASERGVQARPTLREVAALAGVSMKTASRVLNGEQYVSSGTAAKVQLAADQVGFRLNVIARELRVGAQSTLVGLIITDISNPFYAHVARGAERRLRSAGMQLITACSDEDPLLERQLATKMLERRVSAMLVVTSTSDHAYLDTERRRGMPVAFLDRPSTDIVADTVALDNEGGARQAVEHLIAHGHRRIGLIGHLSRLSTHCERIAGFGAAMTAAGVDDWESYVRSDSHDVDSAERAARELLAMTPAPTALFTTNNRITVGALHAMRDLPSPPAIIGFDDFDLADLLGVTVIGNSPERMGEIAADLVLARLSGNDEPAHQRRLPAELIARGSGERSADAVMT